MTAAPPETLSEDEAVAEPQLQQEHRAAQHLQELSATEQQGRVAPLLDHW